MNFFSNLINKYLRHINNDLLIRKLIKIKKLNLVNGIYDFNF